MPRLTREQLADIAAKRGYGISSAIGGRGKNPKLESNLGDAALATPQAQTGDSGFFHVCVTSFRRRLLDEDNLCEKFHVDCCRYSGLIPDDAPDKARIKVRQEKVKSREEERTEIVIERLPNL